MRRTKQRVPIAKTRGASRRRCVNASARTDVVLINVLKQRLTFTLIQFWRIRSGKSFIEDIFIYDRVKTTCVVLFGPEGRKFIYEPDQITAIEAR